jgi:hypothetical protein
MKYLAMHHDNFESPVKAFISVFLGVLAILFTEVLVIQYIMIQGTPLAVLNNFVKMKIISMMSLWFIAPYQNSSLARYMNSPLYIDRFRKQKAYVTKQDLINSGLIVKVPPVAGSILHPQL